jgi:hypothetical protein
MPKKTVKEKTVKVVTPKPKVEVKKDLYKLKITLENDVLKGEGDTALQALRSIEEPLKVFTKGQIKMSYKGKIMEQTWNPIKVRRLFMKISQPILAKQFTYLLR